jgi:site-specific recombinase XerD
MEGQEVVLAGQAGHLAEIAALETLLGECLADSVAPNTARAYQSDWRHFTTWCDGRGFAALPASPEAVAYYVAAFRETLAPATLTRRVSAIASAHGAAGFDTPTHAALVRRALSGARRRKGTAPDRKAPVTENDLREITAAHLPTGAKGARDAALLLVGFFGGFRRSELVGIDVEHVAFVGEGAVITLPRSKTDQEGEGRPVAIPFGHEAATCPVAALRKWLTAAGIDSGPVFRPVNRHGQVSAERLTGRAVALVVKHYMQEIGKDTAAYSGHSLRAGFVTAAAHHGALDRDIMATTGHKSAAMIQVYTRDANLFHNAAALRFTL